MPESQSSSILDQFQPGVDLWSSIITLGRSLIQGLIDKVTCQHWIQDPIIGMLAQPMKCLW